MNGLGFVPKGLLGDLFVHINQKGLYIATSTWWPGCSKQYCCIPALGCIGNNLQPPVFHSSALASGAPTRGMRDLGINRPGWDY
ncbi:hypothetical protein BDW68DRAFT_165992, partial [Aspergillus falconensis]